MQNEKRILALLLGALISVRDNKRLRNPKAGICNGIADALKTETLQWDEYSDVVHMLRGGFRKWPKFSGDIIYPIRGAWYSDEVDTFAFSSAQRKQWSKLSRYGRDRWRLLHWLIAHFEQKLKEFPDEDSSSA